MRVVKRCFVIARRSEAVRRLGETAQGKSWKVCHGAEITHKGKETKGKETSAQGATVAALLQARL